MFDTDNWPEFAEELGRKISVEVEKWTRAYEAGRISTLTFLLLISTLYDATSGLAPKEISNLLADLHKELRLELKRKRN